MLGIELPVNFSAEDDMPEYIAREMLDPLSEKILRLIHMLIKQNKSNAERVTKYENIIYMMLTRYEVKIVSKIFKETYKRAEVVRGEGEDFSGNDSINALAAAVGGALTGQVFGAAMKKWVDRLESIQYVSPKEENLTK